MKLIRCPQGHFYDGDLHDACPYCDQDQKVVDFFDHPVHKKIQEDSDWVTIPADHSGHFSVVGWLVCVRSPEDRETGKSFELYAGFNSIPGKSQPDAGESKVVFDPKSQTFYLFPHEDRQTELNGVAIRQPQTIKAYDEIRIRDTGFLFVPFCGPDFTWPQATGL